jgi:hypothetical protein
LQTNGTRQVKKENMLSQKLLDSACEHDVPDLIEGSEDGSEDGETTMTTSAAASCSMTSRSASRRRPSFIHRRVRLDTVVAAKACKQNAWVGMLLSDYDWAESGVLELARQIQSEYWSLVSNS